MALHPIILGSGSSRQNIHEAYTPDPNFPSLGHHPVGTIGYDGFESNSRAFVYVLLGSNVGAGQLLTRPAVVANHHNLAVVSDVSVGEREIEVTLGATAAAENAYAGGVIAITDGAGEGFEYRIKQHAAGASTGNMVVELVDPVAEALASATSTASLLDNGGDLPVASGGATEVPVGVACADLAAGEYGWAQCWGLKSTLTTGTPGVGVAVIPAAGGAVAVRAAVTQPIVGIMASVGVNTEYQVVDLMIKR